VLVCTAPPDTTGYLVTEHQLQQEEFKVTVACSDEYIGIASVVACTKADTVYKLSGCEKKVFCRASTKQGYDVDERSLVVQSFDVTAKCAAGFTGSAKVEACSKTDDTYTLSGCQPFRHCVAPASTNGYTIEETSLRISTFDVKVTCAAGYTGTAAVQACTSDGDTYSLSGCDLDPVCVAPEGLEAYSVTESDLHKSSFDVSAACAKGYVGQAKVTACTNDGESYEITGCKLDPVCSAPEDATGYVVTETHLSLSKFDVQVECAVGFEGKASAQPCTSDGDRFTLSGCEKTVVCIAPSDSTGYAVSEIDLKAESFDVKAECAAGYVGTAAVEECSSDAEEYVLSGCEKDKICSAPADAAGYDVTETALSGSKFEVAAACAAGYLGTAVVDACSEDGAAYSLSGCEKDKMCTAPAYATGYTVTEAHLAGSKFDVTAECANGYVGTAVVTACTADAEAYTLSGCDRDKICSAPADATGYALTEAVLQASKFDVTVQCAVGYVGTAAVTACSADGEAYTLSGCEKVKTCSAPADATGYDVTETVLTQREFDVSAACAAGYLGTAVVDACSEDGAAYSLSGCEKDKMCTAPADATGYTVTEAHLAGSKFDVTAECANGYVGTAVVTACTADAEAYALSGCDRDSICSAPADATGYALTEVVLQASKFDVSVQCASGYLGTALVTACSSDGEAYTLSGCEKEKMCTAPADATGYDVTETVLSESKFDVTVECSSGYVGNAVVAACSADAEPYALSGCEKDRLCSAPADATGYIVTENALSESKFDVTAECADGYFGTAAVAACSSDGSPYTLSGCEEEKMCTAPADATGYAVTEAHLAASKFDVTAECAKGYVGSAAVTVCSANADAYTLSGCAKPVTCVAVQDATAYKITETSLSTSNFDVSAECAEGYVGTASVSPCSNDGEPYVVDGCAKKR